LVKSDKEGHYILIKGVINQEEITAVSLYATKGSAPNFIKHIPPDLKEQIDNDTMTVGNFSTLLLPIDRYSDKKINGKTSKLNDSIDQMDHTDIYRVFLPRSAQYTLFPLTLEFSPKQIIFQGIKQLLADIRKLK
jgi:hypothetical protein